MINANQTHDARDAWMAIEGLIAAGATLEEVARCAREQAQLQSRQPQGAAAG